MKRNIADVFTIARRAAHTLQITWNDITLNRDDIPKPIIKEVLSTTLKNPSLNTHFFFLETTRDNGNTHL